MFELRKSAQPGFSGCTDFAGFVRICMVLREECREPAALVIDSAHVSRQVATSPRG